MTASNGNVGKDDDNRLSQYRTNIILGDSLASNEKDHKSLWVESINNSCSKALYIVIQLM